MLEGRVEKRPGALEDYGGTHGDAAEDSGALHRQSGIGGLLQRRAEAEAAGVKSLVPLGRDGFRITGEHWRAQQRMSTGKSLLSQDMTAPRLPFQYSRKVLQLVRRLGVVGLLRQQLQRVVGHKYQKGAIQKSEHL